MARIDTRITLSERDAKRAAHAIEIAEKGAREPIARRFGFKETKRLYAAIRQHMPDWRTPPMQTSGPRVPKRPKNQTGRLTHGAVGHAGFSAWEPRDPAGS